MDMRKYSRRSAYIKVEDVREEPCDETIAFVKEGRFGKPGVTFQSGKVLSINASNTEILISAYGNNSDGWIGKQVELYLGAIRYQGEENEAVLIKPISPAAKPAKVAKSVDQKSTSPDFDDDVPF